jgi:hypothetical protein
MLESSSLAAGLVFTTDIHQLQYLNFGAVGLVFTTDIHQLQYLNFGAAGLVFTTDIHQLQYPNYGAAGLLRGIRHRNLAAIKMATQRGITQLQGPGDKEYQYQATTSLALSSYRSIFRTVTVSCFHYPLLSGQKTKSNLYGAFKCSGVKEIFMFSIY